MRVVPELVSLMVASGLALAAPAARAEEAYTLVLKDHRFEPSQLEVPAGQKVRLVIRNLDSVTEEFDSHDLHVEKLIPSGKEGTLTIGPLDPGGYDFIGEFHSDTAHGRIVAK
jgi:plastocyanin